MAQLAFHLDHGGVILSGLHGGLELGDVLLRGLVAGFLIDGADPVKIVVPHRGGIAHHKGAVLADDKGIDQGVLLLQGEDIGQVADGQLPHHGDAVLHTRDIEVHGGAHQHHLFPGAVVAHGHPALSPLHGGEKGRGAGKLDRVPVNHLKVPVGVTPAHRFIVPALPVVGHPLIIRLLAVLAGGRGVFREGFHGTQALVADGAKMLGDPGVDVGHVNVAQLGDGLIVLPVQVKRQRRECRDAHKTHTGQTTGQEMLHLVFHRSVYLPEKTDLF